jgi:hypothetical protein
LTREPGKKRFTLATVAALAVLAPALWSVSSSVPSDTGRESLCESTGVLATVPDLPTTEKKRIYDTLAAGSTPSLEMRENTDFLITPVFLVRQVMSTDSLLTYPTE